MHPAARAPGTWGAKPSANHQVVDEPAVKNRNLWRDLAHSGLHSAFRCSSMDRIWLVDAETWFRSHQNYSSRQELRSTRREK